MMHGVSLYTILLHVYISEWLFMNDFRLFCFENSLIFQFLLVFALDPKLSSNVLANIYEFHEHVTNLNSQNS